MDTMISIPVGKIQDKRKSSKVMLIGKQLPGMEGDAKYNTHTSMEDIDHEEVRLYNFTLYVLYVFRLILMNRENGPISSFSGGKYIFLP